MDMAEKSVQRKLVTILAADVAGYSRLVHDDEEATVKALNALRKRIDRQIAGHDGRVFGSAGDSVIAEFASPVEAVRCATEIQKTQHQVNKDVTADRRMVLRIGVNIGDVMVEGANLLGDGVNIAARLEGLAEPGGICISSKVHEEIKDKVKLGFKDLGVQMVKNIAEPVRAFRVLLDPADTGKMIPARRAIIPSKRSAGGMAAVLLVLIVAGIAWWQPWVSRVELASLERMAFPLPDKPSIAVLPFANLSGDDKQDYLGDGIAENITTALSRIPDMFVIARSSTLSYKGMPVKVQQVAEELGVRYVLEGSIQISGNKVRVTAQLIDALKGHHLWAERYDRDVKDTFALQDDITLNVVTALEIKLTDGARARLVRGNTNNLEAYQLLQRGFRHFLRFTKEDNAEAQRLYKKVVKLDPNYATVWHYIGLTHWISAVRGWGEDNVQDEARAEELAHKALAIDPSAAGAYNLLANLALYRRQYDEAIAYGEKAVALAPNNSSLTALLGRTFVYAGRPDKALPLIQRGIRLSPNTPPNVLRFEGLAYYTMRRYKEAMTAFGRARARNPKSPLPLAWLALTYADMGRMEEARTVAKEVLKVNPSFSVNGFVNSRLAPQKDRTKSQQALATLLKLGLPR
jgi:adenylate cyclase